MFFHASEIGLDFRVPGQEYGEKWQVMIDTADPVPGGDPGVAAAGGRVPVRDRSLVVLGGLG